MDSFIPGDKETIEACSYYVCHTIHSISMHYIHPLPIPSELNAPWGLFTFGDSGVAWVNETMFVIKALFSSLADIQ